MQTLVNPPSNAKLYQAVASKFKSRGCISPLFCYPCHASHSTILKMADNPSAAAPAKTGGDGSSRGNRNSNSSNSRARGGRGGRGQGGRGGRGGGGRGGGRGRGGGFGANGNSGNRRKSDMGRGEFKYVSFPPTTTPCLTKQVAMV